MAFDVKEFKRKAKAELSTRNGGNLRNKSIKIPQDQITVFIGLGGLGCKAVNAIKGVAEQKLDNSDRRFYLVIDTDLRDMNDISEVTTEDLAADVRHGWMKEDEKCPLFNEINSYSVATLPHDIDDWVDRNAMDREVISGQGAHAIRQIGRIMLFSKGNYEAVYDKIEKMINRAVEQRNSLPSENQNGKIKIYIVAGISGGTGSGTIVDISYMVRKILKQHQMESFNVEGVLFTPDVQESDRGIEPADRVKLKRNFYAAIKEIDYFYNNRTRKKAYVCPKHDIDAAYEYDIFDSCTILSRFSQGRRMSNNSGGVIDKVANAITYEISSIRAANTGDAQARLMPLSSYMDNEPSNVSAWINDTEEGRGMNIPEWAPPRYSTLGYGSFYIPRDELLAYCANKLMKNLMDTWNKNILDSKGTQRFMAKYGINTLHSFGAKLFELAGCTEYFNVPHKDMPRDPDSIGLIKVKNCISYLEEMKEIALDEGQEMNAKQHIREAALKTDGAIVNPLCTHFDKAFLDEIPGTGPAYAVRLLSSIDSSNPGILANLSQMLNQIENEANAWEAELTVKYDSLYRLGEMYESKTSVDKSELEDYTAQCRDFGEQLLQAKMLRYSYNALYDVYTKINNKNNELFNIYTVALQYLVEMLEKDSDYVTNPQRCREGNNTVFSFDIVNFEVGDETTRKFMTLFDGLVDNMEIDKNAKNFVDDVFKQIKVRLASANNTDKQFSEDDVLDVIREYFSKTFSLWTDDVIERFCIIAYSQLDIKPEDLTSVWSDESKVEARNAALSSTAQTINLQLQNAAGVLLSTSDSSKDIEKFNGYTALLAIPETKNINKNIRGHSIMNNSWSEFVLFKRKGGIPLCFIDGLEEYQKVYASSVNPGLHLDEVGDNWKTNLPEPYGYNIRSFMNKYENSGSDQVEYDKKIMTEILGLANEAQKLGLLSCSQNVDETTNAVTVFYNMYYDFVAPIHFEESKNEIAQKLKTQVQNAINNNSEYSLMKALSSAGYQMKEPVEIRWTYAQSQFNGLMRDCTGFGTDTSFGNFVTLIRSNYDWYIKLKNAVEIFSKLNRVYEEVLGDINDVAAFNMRISALVDAIKVNRFVPFYINDVISGFEIKITNDSSQNKRFLSEGLKAMDMYFMMYLSYVEGFMKIDENTLKGMRSLMDVDFNMDHHVDWSRAARNNVDWFISETDKIINDTEMLNHYSTDLLSQKIADLVKYSKYEYSLPELSDGNKNVAAVISNLKAFYFELRNVLASNRVQDDVPYIDELGAKQNNSEQNTQPAVSSSRSAATWICPTCGKENNEDVNFCPVDGTKKIEKKSTWICPTCGKENNEDINFCPVDGTKKVEKKSTWICPTCGRENAADVNFCPVDGTRKVEKKASWFCPVCGKENDANVNFCPVDGTKKG